MRASGVVEKGEEGAAYGKSGGKAPVVVKQMFLIARRDK